MSDERLTPGELRDVFSDIVERSSQLSQLDSQLSTMLSDIQHGLRRLRPTDKPVDVPFPPWGKLGWSGRRGYWRLVVVDDEGCEDLLQMPRLARADAFKVLPKLLERLGMPTKKRP